MAGVLPGEAPWGPLVVGSTAFTVFRVRAGSQAVGSVAGRTQGAGVLAGRQQLSTIHGPGFSGCCVRGESFALPAGAWVDRHPRRRQIMIVADLGRAGLLLAVPLLW